MNDPDPVAARNPSLRIDSHGIAWIEFDDPQRSRNVLSEGVMRTFSGVIEKVLMAARAGDVSAAVVWSGKPSGFIVGADISEIQQIEDPLEGERASRLGQAIFMEVEELPVPTVAAIHGICLGGGTELGLACRYRIASDDDATELGLPEVQLGILPAWGGTTRLPRLIGARAALDLLLTGRRVSASSARRRGLVDEVFPVEIFREKVEAFTRARITAPRSSGPKRGLFARLLEDTSPGRRLVVSMARKKVLARTAGHYPAPLKILEVVRDSLGKPLDVALALEAAAAGELMTTGVSKNLVHVFQLREAARKDPVEDTDAVEDAVGAADGETATGPVRYAGVLGAGVMGGGIAQLLAYHDVTVRMKDVDADALTRGYRQARSLFDEAVDRRKLTRREADRKMGLVSGSLTYAGFGRLDVVVEAVVERIDVKREVLADVERRVPERCTIASNTSSLSLDAMATALERPERFGGLHFFNPVHRMPLVEIVRGSGTSDDTVATLRALATRLGKVPVVVQRDRPGFLVNRILGPYINEAGHLLGEGASVEDVDRAAEKFGMPMGPLRLVDEVGVDVTRHAGETLHEAFGERMRPAPALAALGETDRLGRKGGLGFYRYEEGEPTGVDPDLAEVLGEARATTLPARGSRGEAPDAREICARLVLAMVNEAARVLEEGVVARAADVDLGMIMGTGFPPFRGGLLRYADDIHPRDLLARTESYHERLGPRFEPAPLLRRLAREDREFYRAFP